MVKKLLLCLGVCCLSGILHAQTPPANDDCATLVDLGTAPVCNATVYSNVGATPSVIATTPSENIPACFVGGAAQRDVWFAFTCPENILDFRVSVSGAQPNLMLNPQVVVYRGDCSIDGLAEFYCARAEPGTSEVFVDLTDLTKNDRYFIRVSDYAATSAPNAGNFTICIEEIPPAYKISDLGSTLCKGTLFDTGGPEGNYDHDENYTFTICPSSNPKCIRFTLEYYHIEPGKDFGEPFDFLSFHDGKDLNAPIIGTPIGGESLDDGDGGGGVLYEVQASSGCLTVHFESDSKVQYQGWKGNWVCSDQPCTQYPPITIDTAITNGAIAAFLETPFTNVSVAKVNCPRGGYGTFRFPTDKNELGLGKGLVLTSGRARTVFNTGEAFANHEWEQSVGDDDLDYLSLVVDGKNMLSVDACVVEVDAFVASDELSFEYVFGSEEYPEYVLEEYNDIFAFLVSGPGITGDPNIKNQKNIAVLPGTNTAIQIDNVNNLINWPYYRDNRQSLNIVYDGLTADSLGRKKQLTARTKVIPCNTYHLKFAVADRYALNSVVDRMYDSGVFIANIRGGGPEVSMTYGSGVDYFVEDCTGNLDQLVFTLAEAKDKPTSYTVQIGGTATLGQDYALNLPNVITFQPGQTRLVFPIEPLTDNLTEGTETIEISISADFGCGSVVFSTVTVDIRDNLVLDLEGGDTVKVCAGATHQLQASGAVQYFWQPPGLVSNPFIANPNITPTQSRWYKVSGKISTCTQEDSVYVDVIHPALEVMALGKTTICLGDTVRLMAQNNTDNIGISWLPETGLSDPTASNPLAKPTRTTVYTATLTVGGCSLKKDVKIVVDTMFFPKLVGPDTSICQGYSIRLGEQLKKSSQYQWTPATGLNNPNVSGPLATPSETTTYTLTVQTPNGGCAKSDTVRVLVTPARVSIAGDPARKLCLGDTLVLQAGVSPGDPATVRWTSSLGDVFATGAQLQWKPEISTTLIASYTVNKCIVHDSVVVRVDSLPYILDIVADTMKPEYCPGELLLLTTPYTFDPGSFPGIQNEWLPFKGQDPPLKAWSLVITTTETHLFQRVTTIGACRDTAEILIKVAQIPKISAVADEDTICPGQATKLRATVDPPSALLEWDNVPGLSCTQCPDPLAMPTITTQYRVRTSKAVCPVDTTVTVYVGTAPRVLLPADLTICPEWDTSLLLNLAPPDAGVQYNWYAEPPGFSSQLAQPEVKVQQSTVFYLRAKGQCLYYDTLKIAVAAPVQVNAGPDQTICMGQSAQLSAAANTIGTILWDNQQANAVVTVTPPQTTTYKALLVSTLGCRAEDSVIVFVRPLVVLKIVDETGQDTLCAGDPVSLRLVELSPPGTLVYWPRGDVLVPFPADSLLREIPSVGPDGIGIAEYKFSTSNESGCPEAEQQFRFVVTGCFALPNAFTPNGDETNDSFGPALFGSKARVLQFDIYSRWGQQVFSVTENGPSRWNGLLPDGQSAPSDVYVYILKVLFADGREEIYKGEVSLLR